MENRKEISQDTLDKLNKILHNVPPTEAVELNFPSKGKFYTPISSGKPYTIRPMTFDDEKAILGEDSNGVNILLARTISNLNVNEMLQMDKIYALMKLRSISVNPEYSARIDCPKCGKTGMVDINLEEFNINYVPDSLKNPRTGKLPIAQKEVTVRFPRVKDEEYTTGAQNLFQNLWRFVDTIDGEKDHFVIAKVIEKLPLKDVHYIINLITMPKLGLDTNFEYVCVSCKKSTVIGMPISEDFFTMNSEEVET